MNRAEQKVTQPMQNITQKLTAEDLEALADEASRQNLSLACLIAAMEDDSAIAWMDQEMKHE